MCDASAERLRAMSDQDNASTSSILAALAARASRKHRSSISANGATPLSPSGVCPASEEPSAALSLRHMSAGRSATTSADCVDPADVHQQVQQVIARARASFESVRRTSQPNGGRIRRSVGDLSGMLAFSRASGNSVRLSRHLAASSSSTGSCLTVGSGLLPSSNSLNGAQHALATIISSLRCIEHSRASSSAAQHLALPQQLESSSSLGSLCSMAQHPEVAHDAQFEL